MKRYISLLFAIVLCVSMVFGATYAEETPEGTKPFDLSVFESSDCYSYDKFDKKWDLCGAYLHQYSNATVVLGIDIWGYKNSVEAPPCIYAWIREANNKDVRHSITGLQFFVNDTLFSATRIMEGDTLSSMYLDSVNGKELLSAIASSNEMDVKMIYDSGSHIATISGDEYTELQKVAKLIVDNDSWAYVCDIDGIVMSDWDVYINEEYPIVIDTDG